MFVTAPNPAKCTETQKKRRRRFFFFIFKLSRRYITRVSAETAVRSASSTGGAGQRQERVPAARVALKKRPELEISGALARGDRRWETSRANPPILRSELLTSFQPVRSLAVKQRAQYSLCTLKVSKLQLNHAALLCRGV